MTSLRKEFDQVYGCKPNAKSFSIGKLKFAEIGLGWKDSISGSIVTVNKADIDSLHWARAARGYQLIINKTDDNEEVKFDGFSKDAFEQLKNTFSELMNLNLEVKEYSLRGWNWGKTEFVNNNLSFVVADKPAFEVPLKEIISTSLASKNEVSLEFSQANEKSTGSRKTEDSLVEIRFFIPGMATREQLEDEESKSFGVPQKEDDSDVEEKNEDGEIVQKFIFDRNGEAITAANLFNETLKRKGEIGTIVGESIVTFKDMLCLTPRGRFELELHKDFFRLRGKSHDYKILFSSINKMFMIPKVLGEFMMFVVGLEPPLRQGQTRYPFLLFQFEKDVETEVELNLSVEDLAAYEGNLKKSYDAPLYEVISDVFFGMTKKKLITSNFRSSQLLAGIKCSMKANEAILYPLDRQILSIPKPPTLIPHNQIVAVTFSRVGGGLSTTKTFEVKFSLDNGIEHSYSSIPREEYNSLVEYCHAKKLQVENEMNDDTGATAMIYDDDDGSDEEVDERFSSRKRDRPAGQAGDEDESSVDEDFEAPRGNQSEASSSASSDEDGESEGKGNPSDDNTEGESEPDEKGIDKPEKEGKKEVKKVQKATKKESSSSSKPQSSTPPKKRAKKDPNAPKKGLSSYMFFGKAIRPKVLEDNPGIAFTEVAKEIGKLWAVISPSEKEKYEELAKKDTVRYKKEMESYVPAPEEKGVAKIKKSSSSSSAKKEGSSISAKVTKKEVSSSSKGAMSTMSKEFVNSDSD